MEQDRKKKPELVSLNDPAFLGLSIEELDARLELEMVPSCFWVGDPPPPCPDKTCALQRLCKFCAEGVASKSSADALADCCPADCIVWCAAYCAADCPCAGGGYCPTDCPTYNCGTVYQ